MEQAQFLEEHVFKGCNIQKTPSEPTNFHFSEADFATILERCEYFGIGLYSIETYLNDAIYGASHHEDFRKKATDAAWYKKAFSTFHHTQEGLTYAATYKVSKKLLDRY